MTLTPTCSICCEKFTTSSVVLSTKCGHLFHNDCIQRWRNRNSSCPECRQSTPTLSRIYFNFNNTEEEAESTPTMNSTTPQEVENLIFKLSIEEARRKAAEESIQETLLKQYETARTAKRKEDEHEKLMLSFKMQLEKEQRRRVAAEESEKSLRKHIDTLKRTSPKREKQTTNLASEARKSSSSSSKSKERLAVTKWKREIEIFDLETDTCEEREEFDKLVQAQSGTCSRNSSHSACCSRRQTSSSFTSNCSRNGRKSCEVRLRDENFVVHYHF